MELLRNITMFHQHSVLCNVENVLTIDSSVKLKGVAKNHFEYFYFFIPSPKMYLFLKSFLGIGQ